MTCTDVQKILGAYVDGELDSDQAQCVAVEVDRCPQCRAELQRLKELGERIRTTLMAEVAEVSFDGLWLRIESEINPASASSRSWWADLRVALGRWLETRKSFWIPVAATGAVALIAIAIMTGRGGEPTPGEAPSPSAVHAGIRLAAADIKEPGIEKAESHGVLRRAPEGMVASNEAYIEQYEVESGTVVIDQDPDHPEQPLIVWHFLPEDEARQNIGGGI